MDVPEVDVAALPDEAVLLDVREPDEWVAGHAPRAVHVPLGQLADRLGELPQDGDVHVVCRSGGRSAQATRALNQAGYSAVNVAGGMNAWAAAGKPMESENGRDPEVA